jgi:predicted nuclease of predicted toxin-antitoxin system
MKILIDQNISFRIIHHLEHLSFDLHHVKTLGLTDANDHQIFRFARQNAFDV